MTRGWVNSIRKRREQYFAGRAAEVAVVDEGVAVVSNGSGSG